MAVLGTLPLDLIIDITSTGVKDAFTLGKLNTIIIKNYNDNLPNEKFNECFTLDEVQTLFGFGDELSSWAGVYFGVISKNATKCDRLWVYNWSKTDTPAVLKGGKAPSISKLKALNGKFKITIGATEEEVTLDLSSFDNYSDMANAMQTALRLGTGTQFTQAEVSYSPVTQGFIIKSGISGADEKISFLAAGSTTDIHDKMGLTEQEGAKILLGTAGKSTLAEVLQEINEINGNYYLITHLSNEINGLDDLKTFGTFLNASNDRFLGVASWDNIQLVTPKSNATEELKGFNGLFIDYQTTKNQHALPCGLVSAMDLKKPNGNYNIAFNDASIFNTTAITDKTKYNALLENKANAPAKFGIMGQNDTIYQNGTILGSKTDSANVYLCNSFLKFSLQVAGYNMLKSQNLISLRGNTGENIIKSYFNEALNNAVLSNIIVQGAELTTTEKNVIISAFGSLVTDINSVLEQVSQVGYFYMITNRDLVNRTLGITMCYVANKPTDKIIVNNYILGA